MDLPRRAYAAAVAALTVFFLLTNLVWALIAPPLSGPDEYAHYNSVTRLVAGGGWPRPYEAKITDATITAVAEAGGSYLDQSLDDIPAPADRSLLLEGDVWERNARDQMVQHPPLYYGMLAAVVELAGGDDLRWDQAQLIMRAMSAAMVAGAIPFLVGIGRRMTGSRLAGIVAGASPLLIPFFTNAAGFVNNDSLLILACSASLYLMLAAADRGRRTALLLAAGGAALGVALFTKGLALLLIPVVAVLAVVAAVRSARGLRRVLLALLPLAIAFVIGGWWWARNLLILGKLQPSILGDREPVGDPAPGFDPVLFAVTNLQRLNRTFWGRGARGALAFPTTIVDIAGIALLILVVVAFVVARRRGMLAALWAFPVLILTTTLGNALSVYWDLGAGDISRGVQGRYVFPGFAAVAASVAVVFAWGVRAAGPRVRSWAAVVVVVLAATATWIGAGWVFARQWPDGGVRAAEAAALAQGVPTWWIVALPWAAFAALAVCAAVLLAAGRRRHRDASPARPLIDGLAVPEAGAPDL